MATLKQKQQLNKWMELDIERLCKIPEAKQEMDKAISRLKKQHERDTKEKGYLYLIRCGDYYKIGITQNIEQRLSSFKTSIPFDIELVLKEKFNYIYKSKIERELHKEFKHKLHKGEWYNLDKGDIDKIKQRLNGYKQMDIFKDGYYEEKLERINSLLYSKLSKQYT